MYPIHIIKAMYGMIFFGEIVPLPWYFGATLIACGMWALSSVSVVEDTKEKSNVSNKESDSSLGRGRSLRSSSESRQVSRSNSPESSVSTDAVSYTHLTLPTILRV